jgi:hypothetical protein
VVAQGTQLLGCGCVVEAGAAVSDVHAPEFTSMCWSCLDRIGHQVLDDVGVW